MANSGTFTPPQNNETPAQQIQETFHESLLEYVHNFLDILFQALMTIKIVVFILNIRPFI